MTLAPPTSNQITIKARLFPWQRAVLQRAARFTVVAAGRRAGKTTLAAVIALNAAVNGAKVWWVAPSFGQATIAWNYLRPALLQLPDDVVTLRTSERSITFAGGGSIRLRSAERVDLLRGEGLDVVILDEAAYIDEEAWTAVLRPALADRRGSAVFISTPSPDENNWFANVYLAAQHQRDWYAAQFPTSVNPRIPTSEIEDARRSLPDTFFRREFLAEFVGSTGSVFRHIDEAIDDTVAPVPSSQIIIACDIATDVDYTVLAVYDATQHALIALDRFHRIDYPALVARIDAWCDRWNPATVIIEKNGVGQAVIDYLAQRRSRLIAWNTTAQSKAHMIVALQTAFERRTIRICRHDALIAELRAFRATRRETGTIHYAAAPGHHDDCVMALAMAHWHAHQSSYSAVVQVIR